MRAALLGVLMTSVVLLACGSPDTPLREFVYTPVPYTPFPPDLPENCQGDDQIGRCGRGVSVDERGGLYLADQVVVVLEADAEDDFISWVDSYGFTVGFKIDNSEHGFVTLAIGVPIGSVPAAVTLMGAQPGVRSAEPHVLFQAVEDL